MPGARGRGAEGIHLDRYEAVRCGWPGAGSPRPPPPSCSARRPHAGRAAPADRPRPASSLSSSWRRARTAGAARQPHQLLRTRGLPPLLVPLLPRAPLRAAAGGVARPPEQPRRRRASARWTAASLVHLLLEELDFQRPRVPAAARWRRSWPPGAPVRTRTWRTSAPWWLVHRLRLFARVAAARRVRSELPFAFTLEPPGAGGRRLVVNGVVDVTRPRPKERWSWTTRATPSRAAIPRSSARGLRHAAARVRPRRAARRCLPGRGGALLPRAPDDLAVVAYRGADAARARGQLLEVARGVVEARFEPTDAPHRELCADCPGRASLCSWGPEHTLAELADARRAG